MDTMKPMLAGGNLGSALQRATQHALACGALQPIESVLHVIEEGGVHFLVRELSLLGRQRLDSRRAREAGSAPNPFLPFDPNLFVADVSPTHVALLNKFALIPDHMLIVTRRFEPQEALLCDADFAVLCACLAQGDGLMFYNGGAAAGASQAHKHLQMVPLPLAVPRQCEDFQGVPINALGFAGSLFVRDEKQFTTIVDAGPMAALAAVSGLRSA